MRSQRPAQRVAVAAQREQRGPRRLGAEADQGVDNTRAQLGDPGSPYLLSAEAARYLRFPSVGAFKFWLKAHPVTCKRRGRLLLYDRRALDLAMTDERV